MKENIKFWAFLIVASLIVGIGLTALTVKKEPFQEDYDECMAWAFGDDWQSIKSNSELPDRWNQRHLDIFVMYGSDPIRESLIKVRMAYALYQKTKTLVL